MYEPYDPSSWVEFFFTVAASAAALAGLIIVAMSVSGDFIASSPTHRAHARATLVVLTAAMTIGLIGIAEQPPAWAGLEFGLVSLGFAAVNTVNNRRTILAMSGPLPAAAWRRMVIGYAIAAAGLIGSVSIVAGGGAGGGLYWIALEVGGALVWAIASAWRFLIGVIDERRGS
jgi:hypothetical protein